MQWSALMKGMEVSREEDRQIEDTKRRDTACGNERDDGFLIKPKIQRK